MNETNTDDVFASISNQSLFGDGTILGSDLEFITPAPIFDGMNTTIPLFNLVLPSDSIEKDEGGEEKMKEKKKKMKEKKKKRRRRRKREAGDEDEGGEEEEEEEEGDDDDVNFSDTGLLTSYQSYNFLHCVISGTGM